MSYQQFSILIGHPDKAAMESIRVRGIDDGIDTQYLEKRLKELLAGKEQGACKSLVDLESLVECDADAAAADVDGPLDERSLLLVALRLKTNGQGDGDAIVFAAIFPVRLRSRRVGGHGGEEYSKSRVIRGGRNRKARDVDGQDK